MSKNRRRSRARADLLGSGLGALALGTLFVLSPQLLGASPITRGVSQALRMPGLVALFVGAVLVALHVVVRRRSAPKTANPAPPSAAANASEAPQPVAPAASWTMQVFHDIEWRRFEAVCEALFGQAGFETKAQSHGADGGVDIWLHSKHAEGPAAVVQCKHWIGKPVGVKEMREFFGVMASHGLKRGTYATSSTFTADALRFAKDNGISALDGAGLLALIAKRTPEQQQALLATAYEGDYWKPTCASCGVKMVAREPKKGGNGFWGCPRYPRCRSTLPLRTGARVA